MTLEGRTKKITKQMQAEGKWRMLSKETSVRIDYGFEEAFKPIKQRSEIKQRGSRAYISDMESGRINLYKPVNLYQKISNYFSNLFN